MFRCCRPFCFQAPTIVFGADVNHPGAGNVSKPSIAAVVASMDRWVSRHGSCVAVQEHRKEVIQVRDVTACHRLEDSGYIRRKRGVKFCVSRQSVFYSC